MAQALLNFHWNGSESVPDVPARWFYIGDEVPEAVAALVEPVITQGRPAEVADQVQADEDVEDEDDVADVAPAVVEPAAAAGAQTSAAMPPKSGPGSSRAAWVAYAEALGVPTTDDDERGDVIARIQAAGHPVS